MVHRQIGRPDFFGLAAAFLTIFISSPPYGQMLKGTILRTITDATQAVVPNAQVNLTETNTNLHRTETTNDSGFYGEHECRHVDGWKH